MAKIYFTLLIALVLLQSCFSTGTATSTEEKEKRIEKNQPFTIDSTVCSVYEIAPRYARVFTADVLDSSGIVKLIDTISHLISNNAYVYFHITSIGDSGTEYAQYSKSSPIYFAEKVIRNQADLNAFYIESHLGYINSVPANSETIFPTVSIIIKDLKDSDVRMSELADDNVFAKSKDFKKLQERLKTTKRKYYPIMRKAFYEQAKSKMWEVDIDVILRGSQIYFYGYEYALNRNIKESYEGMSQIAYDLRFTRVAFGIYNGGEYTYYTPFNGKDTD